MQQATELATTTVMATAVIGAAGMGVTAQMATTTVMATAVIGAAGMGATAQEEATDKEITGRRKTKWLETRTGQRSCWRGERKLWETDRETD